jgi:hypothetical protein
LEVEKVITKANKIIKLNKINFRCLLIDFLDRLLILAISDTGISQHLKIIRGALILSITRE